MDAFTNKLADEHEFEDESAHEKSFSSRLSNGGNEEDYNRVSLPRQDTRKSGANDSIKADGIEFELEQDEKYKHDIEINNNLDHRDDRIDANSSEQFDNPRLRRKVGFGDEEDSDGDEDIDGKPKIQGSQGTVIGVFFP